MKRVGIIADDLTGAMDTGLSFRRLGLCTRVHLGPAGMGDERVAVLDTESRELPPGEAYARVWQAACDLRGRTVYKKIDSTLRGNLGPELDAVLDALELERALIAPAFPAAGRTVLGGKLLVRGVPLRNTDFRDDPLCPAHDHIPTLLRTHSQRRVCHVGVEVASQGVAALVDEIRLQWEELVVVDATRDAHLAVVAGAAVALGEGCMSCGSAGLAGALAGAHLEATEPEPLWAPPPRHGPWGPILVVAGSRRLGTRDQIERALSVVGASRIEIEPDDPEASAERAKEAAGGHLERGRHVILTAALEPYLPEAGHRLARHLGEAAAAAVVRSQPLAGLILTGGATAISVCRALGVDSLEIEAEVAPGIPAGRVVGGPWDGLRVITKAGGFGQKDALVRAIEHLVTGGQDGR
jgi:uncharacterized protein YgbK (DUF1537 family)